MPEITVNEDHKAGRCEDEIGPTGELHGVSAGPETLTYMRLIATDTIEQVTAEALERKAGIAANILGDPQGNAVLTKVTAGECCRMVKTNRLPP